MKGIRILTLSSSSILLLHNKYVSYNDDHQERALHIGNRLKGGLVLSSDNVTVRYQGIYTTIPLPNPTTSTTTTTTTITAAAAAAAAAAANPTIYTTTTTTTTTTTITISLIRLL